MYVMSRVTVCHTDTTLVSPEKFECHKKTAFETRCGFGTYCGQRLLSICMVDTTCTSVSFLLNDN